ncbi:MULTISPECIES: hypothetical protein [Haloferax]|uniref:Uncharacterized protein n=1 Tax=Haloferax marinum TaxID=2666143 RepID=A0A6A8G8L3_9EURY|nr:MULTISPECIES: hypothetical protein [Haloferax]KAB1198398.1 hypothetical protein Hfx1150_13090 [Haloferax sp. CBA1150]MRW97499.1 hypothetical protein [Haloferax marinum]
MIVVATTDFELYHEAVAELRSRGVTFTTIEPGDPLPEQARVLITGQDDDVERDAAVSRVTATGDEARRAVDEALATLRGGGGRTVVGVDPGTRPGIAILSGTTVVAAFHVPLANAVDVIRRETRDAVDPVVRIGDGARLQGAKLINELDDIPVELVDETGTTPYLGSGARGMGDVLAAVNIARMKGERIESREIEPTEGELQRIKSRSREVSDDNRAIDDELARRVAGGELSIDEALDEHRTRQT